MSGKTKSSKQSKDADLRLLDLLTGWEDYLWLDDNIPEANAVSNLYQEFRTISDAYEDTPVEVIEKFIRERVFPLIINGVKESR